jgi:hypothetical protein
MAGCVAQQPWQLPDPYGYQSGGSSSPYYSGSGYGYGTPYGYGSYYSDPYYYARQGYVLPYPAYGYIPYPGYAGHYCRDNDRDGRCDSREHRNDDDRNHDRDHDHDGDADHGGSRPQLGRNPYDTVRRIVKERERQRATGTVSPDAALNSPSSRPTSSGAAPVLRSPPPAPRAEPRRNNVETARPMPRGPRADDAPRGPRDDDTVVRRPLR